MQTKTRNFSYRNYHTKCGNIGPMGKGKNKTCPYWDPDREQQCMMTKGGLYVPMPEHVFMFCSTPCFTSCHHYTMGCERMMEAAFTRGLAQDLGRRRYQRVPSMQPLVIASCDHEGNVSEASGSKARTVDLGLGGMRVESAAHLSVDASVSFTFQGGSSIAGYTGVGEVKWCKEKEKGGGFEAGLAFSDIKTGQAVGRCLEGV